MIAHVHAAWSASARGRGRRSLRWRWPVAARGWALAVLAVGGGTRSSWLPTCGSSTVSRAGPTGRSTRRCPKARGSWRPAFTALYRRVRTRVAYQRDLAHAIERFAAAAEAIPDGIVVLDDANRIHWANARARAHPRARSRAATAASRSPTSCASPRSSRYLEAGDFSEPVVVESQREPGVTLSIQVVPFGVDEKLLIARDITRSRPSRGCAATSSPTFRTN